ncbi:MAG: hypothetical protein JWR05_3541 [Mucilaginibacter sp.]|nr:hypothetical protein [Mucilaginibacter sp.]
MTQEQTALHERFLKGITLKMLGYGAIGLITIVSSFWAGVTAIKESIKDNDVKSNDRYISILRRQDSLQHVNDLNFKDVWGAINNRPTKIMYKTRPTNSGYQTESKDPVTGKITLSAVNNN